MTIFAKPMKKSVVNLACCLAFLAVLSSCDKDRNRPGYSYFPDMEESQAYETYAESPVWENGRTNQLPPEGTVPREMIPFDFEKTEVNRTWAGQELDNPYHGDSSVLEEGKELYGVYCIYCHGEKGDGQGYLFTSGKYPYPPKSLLSDKIRQNPDGEIFHVITVGYGMMGSHAAQVLPDDRWKIITYIREELEQ